MYNNRFLELNRALCLILMNKTSNNKRGKLSFLLSLYCFKISLQPFVVLILQIPRYKPSIR